MASPRAIMGDVRVKKVETRAEFRRFLHFPWKIYEGDPNWVPPLLVDVKEKLSVSQHPFFEHAERDLFLAYRGAELVGRIVGIVDRYHNEFQHEKIAFFGMYESVNDPAVAAALLDAVAVWGKDRGMNTLRGTVNLSLNDECAFLAEGFDSPPVLMMPYNPEYYLELMTACGLAKARDLYAFKFLLADPIPERTRSVIDHAKASLPVILRAIKGKELEEEAERIKVIYNKGWVKNWGFVPWTDLEMKHMVKSFRQMADPEIVILAVEKDGAPVGFAFGIPNYNEVLIKVNGRLLPFGIFTILRGRKKIKSLRVPVFGVVPEYRNTGLAFLLFEKIKENAIRRKYVWAETSWQLEDNEAVNRFVMSLGGKHYKTYRIYERRIA
jgi:GNAT superfamily N-acetyltransferase